jgi:glycine/D-amino acid oxidase-like deaminating enzyme
MSRAKRIVICGGGAIGVAIAYFLSRRGARPIVIERHAVAGAASGKSGGFLALDWCRGSPLDQLARRSFELHAELADELGNPWGYRRLATYGGYAVENDTARSPGRGTNQRPWLSAGVAITGRLGSPQTTALVEPRTFTMGLMRVAEQHGAELRPGTVVDLVRGPGGPISGVALESGEIVEGDAVVIAMGPWSILATRWMPLPAVFGYKGHSLVFKTGETVPAEALFLEYREASGEILAPELFARADGTTWVCAISSTGPLPVDPADVVPDEGAHVRLETMCRNISPALAAAPILAQQACFRPVTEDGLPLIGEVPGADGAYVATGHSVWGMLNAPATGEAMAELVLDGAARHVDLAPFAVGRLRMLDPTRLRGSGIERI